MNLSISGLIFGVLLGFMCPPLAITVFAGYAAFVFINKISRA